MSGPISPFFSPGGGFGITGSRSSGWAFTGGAASGYTVTIYKSPHDASAVDPILQLGCSTAALSAGSIDFLNNNTGASSFLPCMRMTANTAALTSLIRFQTGTGLDTGTVAVGSLDFRIPSSTSIVTRPLLAFTNAGTTVMALSAAGGLSIAGGTAPSLTVGAAGTALTQIRTYSQSLDVASVAANTSAEQTFTVTGLTTADKVFVNKPSLSAGLGVVNARVSAADTLALTFMNNTGSPIDPAAETYTITAIRS